MLGSTDPPVRANRDFAIHILSTWVGVTRPLREGSQCDLKLSVSILGPFKCSHQVSASGMAWYSRSGEGPGACACARLRRGADSKSREVQPFVRLCDAFFRAR